MQLNKTLFAIPLALLAVGATSLFADEHDKKTDVTINEPVQVPGGLVLSPGTYMFILENSESNRNIVEIKSEDGKHLYAMMFTTRAARVNRTGKTVLNFYEMPAGQPQALRQWFWPGDYDGQEFLYPHSEATKMNQVSKEKVPEASDKEYADLKDRGFSTDYPAASSSNSSSDNSSASSNNSSAAVLNQDDQASATQASNQSSTDQSAASVETKQSVASYDATQLNTASQPADSSSQTNASQQTAQANDNSQPDSQPNVTLAQNNPPASSNVAPAPSQDASNNANSNNASLPQTGSDFPAIGVTGLLLLTAGATLHFARRNA